MTVRMEEVASLSTEHKVIMKHQRRHMIAVLLAALFAVLQGIALAESERQSVFITRDLGHGIKIDVPSTWQLLNQNQGDHLKTSAEAVGKNVGIDNPMGQYVNLIGANAYTTNKSASATMRVALQMGPTSTQDEVQRVTRRELDDLKSQFVPIMEAQFREQGLAQRVEWIGAQAEQIAGLWSITMEYRRVSPSGEAFLVKIYQFFLGDREIKLTLSCNEDERILFTPVLRAIRDSLCVEGVRRNGGVMGGGAPRGKESVMSHAYGDNWPLILLISAVLTWGVGLAPPLLIRFAFLRRPMTKTPALITAAVLWFVNLAIAVSLGSKSKGHTALFLVAWASYAILRKGVAKN